MFFACGIWCLAEVSSVSPLSEQTDLSTAVCSNEGLTLETSANHQIPQAKNIPYQPLLIKPILKYVAYLVFIHLVADFTGLVFPYYI